MTKAKPSRLTVTEAAEYLGIPEEDLLRSRFRGMEPGRLGYRQGGVLYFNREDLPKPPKAPKAEKAEEDG